MTIKSLATSTVGALRSLSTYTRQQRRMSLRRVAVALLLLVLVANWPSQPELTAQRLLLLDDRAERAELFQQLSPAEMATLVVELKTNKYKHFKPC